MAKAVAVWSSEEITIPKVSWLWITACPTSKICKECTDNTCINRVN